MVLTNKNIFIKYLLKCMPPFSISQDKVYSTPVLNQHFYQHVVLLAKLYLLNIYESAAHTVVNSRIRCTQNLSETIIAASMYTGGTSSKNIFFKSLLKCKSPFSLSQDKVYSKPVLKPPLLPTCIYIHVVLHKKVHTTYSLKLD